MSMTPQEAFAYNAAARSVVLAVSANGNSTYTNNMAAEIFLVRGVLDAAVPYKSVAHVIDNMLDRGDLEYRTPDLNTEKGRKLLTDGPLAMLTLTSGAEAQVSSYQHEARNELKLLDRAAQSGTVVREATGGLDLAFDRLAALGHLDIKAQAAVEKSGHVVYQMTGSLTKPGQLRHEALQRQFAPQGTVPA